MLSTGKKYGNNPTRTSILLLAFSSGGRSTQSSCSTLLGLWRLQDRAGSQPEEKFQSSALLLEGDGPVRQEDRGGLQSSLEAMLK